MKPEEIDNKTIKMIRRYVDYFDPDYENENIEKEASYKLAYISGVLDMAETMKEMVSNE